MQKQSEQYKANHDLSARENTLDVEKVDHTGKHKSADLWEEEPSSP